jgi:hypothetical protein
MTKQGSDHSTVTTRNHYLPCRAVSNDSEAPSRLNAGQILDQLDREQRIWGQSRVDPGNARDVAAIDRWARNATGDRMPAAATPASGLPISAIAREAMDCEGTGKGS